MSQCPECTRIVSNTPGTFTYSCRVPGCMAVNICCVACLCKHYGNHVRKRDADLATLTAERDRLLERLDTLPQCACGNRWWMQKGDEIWCCGCGELRNPEAAKAASEHNLKERDDGRNTGRQGD